MTLRYMDQWSNHWATPTTAEFPTFKWGWGLIPQCPWRISFFCPLNSIPSSAGKGGQGKASGSGKVGRGERKLFPTFAKNTEHFTMTLDSRFTWKMESDAREWVQEHPFLFSRALMKINTSLSGNCFLKQTCWFSTRLFPYFKSEIAPVPTCPLFWLHAYFPPLSVSCYSCYLHPHWAARWF